MTIDQLVTDSPDPGETSDRFNRRSAPELHKVDVFDPSCDPRWDRLATSHPDFSFFHCSAWIRVLCKTYGHKPLALCWSRNGKPVALLPILEVASAFTGRRGVTLPFTDSCGPLYFGRFDSGIVLEKLHVLAQARGWKHFEIRATLASDLPRQPSLRFHGHLLDLHNGVEVLFKRFASPVRRSIRKAEQSGLIVRSSTSDEAMDEFYGLHVRTRRRHGLPPQPVAFFQNIHAEIIKPGLGFIVLASSGSKTVAAAIYFQMKAKAVFKFGASDERYQGLRPNNLVMWHAIRRLAQDGVEILDFGRTSLPNEGLRRFKLGWGATEEPIEYFRFDMRTNDWTASRDLASGFHSALFTQLPLILNRLIGSAIYPHLD